MIDLTNSEEILIAQPSDDYEKCRSTNVLTTELDALAGLSTANGELFRHYILCDKGDFICGLAAIRVPGGTVGEIRFDENHIITKCEVDLNYVVKTYRRDVNKVLEKYVGRRIEFVEEES